MLLTLRAVALAVVSVALVLTIAGCGSSPVAVVGGVEITEAELNDLLIKRFGNDALGNLIDRELLRQAAAERGIEVTEEEMAEEMTQARSQFPTEEAFTEFLAQTDLSQEEWEEEVRLSALVRKLALGDVSYTDEELKAFFEANKDGFAQPATVALSEIVVGSREDAQKVVEELESGAASFEDLAGRYSLSYTRETGGERQEMPISQMPIPSLQEAAQTLPVGEVSDPIAGPEGPNGEQQWFIVKVRDRKEAREATWEADRERIEEQYQLQNARAPRDILQEQMGKTRVQITDPRFQQLNEMYTPVPTEIPEFGAEGTEGAAPVAPEGTGADATPGDRQ